MKTLLIVFCAALSVANLHWYCVKTSKKNPDHWEYAKTNLALAIIFFICAIGVLLFMPENYLK